MTVSGDTGQPAIRDPVVSLILPTYNEAANLPSVIPEISSHLDGYAHEIIVVDDDSPDLTWRVAGQLSVHDPRIRSIRRLADRGLSAAVMAGIANARGDVFAVMDADGQHDPVILPQLIEAVSGGRADVAMGSRAVVGGSYGPFKPSRRLGSRLGTGVARRLLVPGIADPMSGYFVVTRSHYERVAPSINPRGFKILLEIVARDPRPRVTEVGYGFRARRHGTTKLTRSVVTAFAIALVDLSRSRYRVRTRRGG